MTQAPDHREFDDAYRHALTAASIKAGTFPFRRAPRTSDGISGAKVQVDADRLMELHNAGWSVQRIAKAVSISRPTASRLLRQAGAVTDRGHEAKANRAAMAASVMELRKQGLGFNSIARAIGRSHTLVRRIVIESEGRVWTG